MAANSFRLNDKKSNYIIFSIGSVDKDRNAEPVVLHRLDNLQDCEARICACPRLNRLEQSKYLGIVLDDNLNFKVHVESVVKKVRWGVFALSRLKNMADIKLMKILYYAFVQSHLQYCIAVGGGVHFTTIRPLVMLQKRAVRSVCSAGYLEHYLLR
jgi:hypothetical protein